MPKDSDKPQGPEAPPAAKDEARGANVRQGAQRGLLAFEARREQGRLGKGPEKPRHRGPPRRPGKR